MEKKLKILMSIVNLSLLSLFSFASDVRAEMLWQVNMNSVVGITSIPYGGIVASANNGSNDMVAIGGHKTVRLSGVDGSLLWEFDVPGSTVVATKVANLYDFNADGIDEILTVYRSGSWSTSYLMYILDGATGGVILSKIETGGQFAMDLDANVDFNFDGKKDIVMGFSGSVQANTAARVKIFSGTTLDLLGCDYAFTKNYIVFKVRAIAGRPDKYKVAITSEGLKDQISGRITSVIDVKACSEEWVLFAPPGDPNYNSYGGEIEVLDSEKIGGAGLVTKGLPAPGNILKGLKQKTGAEAWSFNDSCLVYDKMAITKPDHMFRKKEVLVGALSAINLPGCGETPRSVQRISAIDGHVIWSTNTDPFIANVVEVISVTDQNNDGINDVVAAINGGSVNELLVLKGQNGEEIYTQDAGGSVYEMISAGDLSGDGKEDYVVLTLGANITGFSTP